MSLNVNGSDTQTAEVNGVTVKFNRRWHRELTRTVTRPDGTVLGTVTRQYVSGGRYSYNGLSTFPKALAALLENQS